MPPRAPSRALPLWKNRNIFSSLAQRRYYSDATVQPLQHEPQPTFTRAQFLRFALSGTARVPGAKRRNGQLDEHLDGFFSAPYVSKQQENSLFNAPSLNLRAHGEDIALSDVLARIENRINSQETAIELQNLRTASELSEALRQFHSRAQYEELLASVNAISARLQKFDVRDHPLLIQQGIYYAAICCSPSALQHYLFQSSESGDPVFTKDVSANMKHLVIGLRIGIRECTTLQKKQMLEVIAGLSTEGFENEVTRSLHSLLDISENTVESEFISHYIEILSIIGAQAMPRFLEIWKTVQEQLRSARNPGLLRNAELCLKAFIEIGETGRAVDAAREISSIVDANDFISTGLWRALLEHDSSGMLRDVPNEQTSGKILSKELDLMEANLGLTWTGQPSDRHRLIYDTLVVPDHREMDEAEVFSMLGEGENTAAGVQQRLLKLLAATTFPNSESDLSKIADLLNEYEGIEVPLGVNKDLGQKYAWFPHCSPVEFVGKEAPVGCADMTAPRSPPSLGLIVARPDCDGVPIKSAHHIHLMQLGYIGARKAYSAKDSSADAVEPWTCTGHIIGWDRSRKAITLLWVGKGYGTIESGLLQPVPPESLPFVSATIDSLEPEHSRLDVESLRPLPAKTYWLDVDYDGRSSNQTAG